MRVDVTFVSKGEPDSVMVMLVYIKVVSKEKPDSVQVTVHSRLV